MSDSGAPPRVFVHPRAIGESSHVGEDTRAWAFAPVLAGARIGDASVLPRLRIAAAPWSGPRP